MDFEYLLPLFLSYVFVYVCGSHLCSILWGALLILLSADDKQLPHLPRFCVGSGHLNYCPAWKMPWSLRHLLSTPPFSKYNLFNYAFAYFYYYISLIVLLIMTVFHNQFEKLLNIYQNLQPFLLCSGRQHTISLIVTMYIDNVFENDFSVITDSLNIL